MLEWPTFSAVLSILRSSFGLRPSRKVVGGGDRALFALAKKKTLELGGREIKNLGACRCFGRDCPTLCSFVGSFVETGKGEGEPH